MKDKRIKLAFIFGGRSGEHEVSLASARSVMDVLDCKKYQVFEIGISPEGAWFTGENVWEMFSKGKTDGLNPAAILADPSRHGLYAFQDGQSRKVSDLDVVFPVLHGTFGEDGTIQGMLELADLAYVGAGVVGSAVGMDKGIFKDVMRANDIPVVEAVIILSNELEENMDLLISRVENFLPYPVFVKPANLGSSVGISKCNNRSDLVEGMREAALFDRRILVERGVDAREIEISVLGNENPQASLPGEIVPSREFYSYESKYVDGSSELIIPAPIPGEIAEQISAFALKAYKAIDCAGMARVDFFIEKSTGKVLLNEINTIPGFTSISMYPKLWEATGITYSQLVDRLIDLALDRKQTRDRIQHSYRRSS